MSEHSQACFDIRTQRCVCPIGNHEARVRAAAPLLLAMLRKLEWSSWEPEYGGGRACPECQACQEVYGGGDPRPGYGAHYEGCALDALLTTLKDP